LLLSIAVKLAGTPILVILLLATLLLNNVTLYGDNLNPGVFAIDSKPYGLTYGEWSAKWWQWLLGIPEDRSPLGDPSGKYCAEEQAGPVWFLAGFNGKTERTCNIPLGKAIFFPIINTECSYSEYPEHKSEQALLTCAEDIMKDVEIEVSLNESQMSQLESYRAKASSFQVTFPPNNVFQAASGPTTAASDGFYLMLEPLPPGKHQLHIKGVDTDFVSDVSYTLIVK
jgi:hypothetical protein